MTRHPKQPRLTSIHVPSRVARLLEGLGKTVADQWLSVTEAASKLGVHPNTVRRAIKRREVRHCYVGRRVLVQLPKPRH